MLVEGGPDLHRSVDHRPLGPHVLGQKGRGRRGMVDVEFNHGL